MVERSKYRHIKMMKLSTELQVTTIFYAKRRSKNLAAKYPARETIKRGKVET